MRAPSAGAVHRARRLARLSGGRTTSLDFHAPRASVPTRTWPLMSGDRTYQPTLARGAAARALTFTRQPASGAAIHTGRAWGTTIIGGAIHSAVLT